MYTEYNNYLRYIQLMVFDIILSVVFIFSVFVGGKKCKEKMDDQNFGFQGNQQDTYFGGKKCGKMDEGGFMNYHSGRIKLKN